MKKEREEYERGFSRALFERLSGLMMTLDEIAGVMRISRSRLSQCVHEAYDMSADEALQMFASDGRMAIRKAQMDSRNNPVMAIWLGKQHLGQKDRVEQEVAESVTIVNDVPCEDDA